MSGFFIVVLLMNIYFAYEIALVSRITGRSTCGNCGEVFHDVTNPWPVSGECPKCSGTEVVRRADDNEDSLRQRLMEYYKKSLLEVDLMKN